MARVNEEIVEGWEWKSSDGACERCRALHGKKWYRDKAGGKDSAENMIRPPLHPHCKCELEPFFERLKLLKNIMPSLDKLGENPKFDNPDLGETFQRGVYSYYDLVWRLDYPQAGPIYGNYGGDKYTQGKHIDELRKEAKRENVNDNKSEEFEIWLAKRKKRAPSPVDTMDEWFAEHDKNYDSNNPNKFSEKKIIADRLLIQRLEELEENPRKWPRPPKTADEVAYARRYREMALRAFKARMDYFQCRQKYGKEKMKEKFPFLYQIFE